MGRCIRSRGLLAGVLALLLVAGGTPAQEAEPPEYRVRLQEAMGRLYDALGREMARPGADPADLQARAVSLGLDPDRIFAFVRDEIRFVPYAGEMRGARGVLTSRGGNALDQALLLRELLGRAGVEARLMRGRLTEQAAGDLVGRFLATGTPPEQALVESVESLEDICAQAGLNSATMARDLERGHAQAETIQKRTRVLAAKHDRLLDDALRAAGQPMVIPFDSLRSSLVRATSDHFWVECRVDRSGKWTALDPCGAVGGQGKVVNEIPADLRARVNFEFKVERQVGGKQETKSILSVPVTLADAMFEPVLLRVLPGQAMPSAPEMLTDSPATGYRRLKAMDRFQVLVNVGPKRFASLIFDRKGKLFEASRTGHVTDLGGGVKTGFGGFGGRAKKEEISELLGVTLTIGIQLPGFDPIRQTRVLHRAGSRLSPLAVIDVWAQPFALDERLLSFRQARAFAENRDLFLGAVVGKIPDSPRGYRFPSRLVDLALIRQQAMPDLEAANVRRLWRRPFVAMCVNRVALDDDQQRVSTLSLIDIIDNPGPFIPADQTGESAAWRSNLSLGAFDSCAEGVVLSMGGGLPPDSNGIRHFERARLTGAGLRVLGPADRAKAEASLFGAEDRRWIEECVPRSCALVLAGETPARTWWCIDTRDGSCVTRVTGGGGQDMTEYKITKAIAEYVLCMYFAVKGLAELEDKEGDKDAEAGLGALELVGCTTAATTSIFKALKAGKAAVQSQKAIGWIAEKVGKIITAVEGGEDVFEDNPPPPPDFPGD